MADIAMVWARLDGEVRGFIVEKGTKGLFDVANEGQIFSARIVTSELHFERPRDARRKPACRLAQGLKAPLGALTQARYGIAWGVLGAANPCYRPAFDYAKKRTHLRRQASAAYQIAQAKLVSMVQEIMKGKLLALQAGRLKEAGKLEPAPCFVDEDE